MLYASASPPNASLYPETQLGAILSFPHPISRDHSVAAPLAKYVYYMVATYIQLLTDTLCRHIITPSIRYEHLLYVRLYRITTKGSLVFRYISGGAMVWAPWANVAADVGKTYDQLPNSRGN